MKVAIYTLGCKVNQYETQAIEAELEHRGHTLVPFDTVADGYIINTCTVTAVSDKKSRQMIRRAQKGNEDAVVAVCGCYAQTGSEEVATLGVDLVMGTADRMAFLDRLEELWVHKGGEPIVAVDNALSRRTFENLSAGGMEGRTRAMLKIEDGCVNFCSYCIIPYARGPVRSMSPEDIVTQTTSLVAQGFQEIVVTGIEISSWSAPEGKTLIDALELICGIDKNVRVRLGSLEPRTITKEFCERAVKLPNLCPHFHLSMQSGCDATLKRMNRKYDSARYYDSVKLLNEYFKRPAVTTDMIVGFPEETEEEFAQTLAFIQKCRFSSMHIFPYSIRKGTPAADMVQVPREIKEDRAHRGAEVATEMTRSWLQSWVGETLPVLFEEEKNGAWRGHAPNYTEVRTQGENLHNEIRDVVITGIEGNSLVGELVTD